MTRRILIGAAACALAGKLLEQGKEILWFASKREIVNYNVVATVDSSLSMDSFQTLRKEWEDADDIHRINNEFQSHGRMLLVTEKVSGNSMEWNFQFASQSDLEEWRKTLLSRNHIRMHLVPPQVKYQFTVA